MIFFTFGFHSLLRYVVLPKPLLKLCMCTLLIYISAAFKGKCVLNRCHCCHTHDCHTVHLLVGCCCPGMVLVVLLFILLGAWQFVWFDQRIDAFLMQFVQLSTCTVYSTGQKKPNRERCAERVLKAF